MHRMVTLGEGASGLAQAVGANYHASAARQSLDHWLNYDPDRIEQEVEFLAANGFNTLRTFLNFDVYEHARERFLEDLHHYANTLATHRILLIAVLFDSFGIEPSGDPAADASSVQWLRSPGTATLGEPDFGARADLYVADVVQTITQAIGEVGDPAVWWIADVWNEPAPATVPFALLADILTAVRARPAAPSTTVGFAYFTDNGGLLAELADHTALAILSGHPYGMFEEVLATKVQEATAIGDAYGGKPLFVSEIGLPGLFQYYGSVLEWLATAGVGFTLWEAYVSADQFRNLTGIFYPEPAADGMVTVRSTTAANALWSLAMQRDPSFTPPYFARAKRQVPGYVFLGPAHVDLSTGAYHALLRDHTAHYGTPDFPRLSLTQPATRTLYARLMTWAFLSLSKFLEVDGTTAAAILQNLSEMQVQYDMGHEAEAEAALLELFTIIAGILLANDVGEPVNYAPEVLLANFEATPNADGTTFDAHFETVVFDVDKDDLSVWFFAHDVAAGKVTEVPLVSVPDTTAYTIDVAGIPLTFGRVFEFGVFVVDGRGGLDLHVLPVTLP